MTVIPRLPLVALAMAFAHSVLAAPVDLEPKKVSISSPPYETISFVTEGPAYGHTDGAVRGKFHRLLLVNAGLAYDRPTVRLETITYGDEGCCRRVIDAWELDLNELERKGVSLPDAATTELKFVRWRAARSAEVHYGKLACGLTGIGSPKLAVSCR